jgi:hypothetical protein
VGAAIQKRTMAVLLADMAVRPSDVSSSSKTDF